MGRDVTPRWADELDRELASDAFRADPHPVYHRLRDAAPVFWSDRAQEWLVTSYDLVDAVLTDPETYSSVGAERAHVARLPESVRSRTRTLGHHFGTTQLNISDPPDHTRLRRAFGRPFVPREVNRLRDRVAATAQRLLADAEARGHGIDVMRDLAAPLPVEVIAELIGIPSGSRHLIATVTLDQRHFFGAPPTRDVAEAFDGRLGEWRTLLTAWIAQRRREPLDDVLTRAAEMIDAGSVTLDEALATCLHLVIAGNSTTTALIGNTVYRLLGDRSELERLERSPELLANAVEETLRVEAPLPRDRRIATRHAQLGDCEIRAGDRVSAVLAAANRDPAHFSEPDRFDIGRSFTTAHHASFGRGVHFCLGAPVARLEAAVAVEAILQRIPSPGLVEGFRPTWHPVATHHGLTELPIIGRQAA